MKGCIADVQEGRLQFLSSQGEQGGTVHHDLFTEALLENIDKSVSTFLIKRLCYYTLHVYFCIYLIISLRKHAVWGNGIISLLLLADLTTT